MWPFSEYLLSFWMNDIKVPGRFVVIHMSEFDLSNIFGWSTTLLRHSLHDTGVEYLHLSEFGAHYDTP